MLAIAAKANRVLGLLKRCPEAIWVSITGSSNRRICVPPLEAASEIF